MKKFFALLMLASMTISMIGCGPEKKKEEPAPATTGTEEKKDEAKTTGM